MSRRYEVVVHGATGRVGRQVVRRLVASEACVRGMRIAISGRDGVALEELACSLRRPVDVLVADAGDHAALRRMAKKTRVVLNLAGPYALCGEPVVAACVREGTHYLDVTGETAHVRRLIDRYQVAAESAGVKVVPFCGFDSVPSDLGVLLLVKQFRRSGRSLREAKGFFRILGRLNSGTVQTALALWRHPADVTAMEDPLLLAPTSGAAGERRRNADPLAPVLDRDLGRWVGPFWTGAINTRVVRRSSGLASRWGEGYGRGFRYQEFWDPGGPLQLFAAGTVAWGMAAWRSFARFPESARWLEPLIPSGEELPSESVGDGGFYRALFVGTAADGSRCWAEVSDEGDPSNQATVKIASECVLTLLEAPELLPGGAARGGLLTPATALGMPLVRRLRRAGIRLRCPL